MSKDYKEKQKEYRQKYAKAFGTRLSSLRANKDVSASKMSDYLGRNHTYISSIENAKSFPKMENFFEICDYLGTTPSEFMKCFDPKDQSEGRSLLYERIAFLNDDQVNTVLNVVNAMIRKR